MPLFCVCPVIDLVRLSRYFVQAVGLHLSLILIVQAVGLFTFPLQCFGPRGL